MKRQMLFALMMVAGLIMASCGTKSTTDETQTQDTTVVTEPAPAVEPAPVADSVTRDTAIQ